MSDSDGKDPNDSGTWIDPESYWGLNSKNNPVIEKKPAPPQRIEPVPERSIPSQAEIPREITNEEKQGIGAIKILPPIKTPPPPRSIPDRKISRPPEPVRPPAQRKSSFLLYLSLGIVAAVGLAVFLMFPAQNKISSHDRIIVPAPQELNSEKAVELSPKPDLASEVPILPSKKGKTSGRLKLSSDPTGAQVFINDEKRGVTPTKIRKLPLGKPIEIRFEAAEHQVWSQTLQLDNKDPHRVIHAGLIKENACDFGSGWVYLTSEPAGAIVEMDGKRLPGKTPMVINSVCAAVGVKLQVRAPGTFTWRQTVKIASGQVLNIKAKLNK